MPHGKPMLPRPCAASVLMAALAVTALAGPAAAQNCWVDVTTHEACKPTEYMSLQFKNICGGGQRTINTCVKWTSGPNSGVVNRLGAYASGGQVAVINPGLCNGSLRYTWRRDGSVPNCP